MSFLRAQGPWSTLVICNFSTDDVDYVVPDEIDIDLAVPIIANYPLEESKFQTKTCLKPYEARVYSLRN